jgi:hypothetical protein
MADTANLAIYQGDDYAAVVTVYDANGNPLDLTGYTANAQIRRGPADQNPAVAAEMAVLIVLPNQINLSVSHTVTVKLSGRYQWDLQLVTAAGAVTTMLAGTVEVTPEITREGVALNVRSIQNPPDTRAVQSHRRPAAVVGAAGS